MLWFIYLLMTPLCALAYWMAGMTLFDAICHSFSTLSVGGFSTHDASIGFFNSPAINLITVGPKANRDDPAFITQSVALRVQL